ncbi:hypothetical protein [Loktanella atrilutea]|uniref:hypothetical protein n=1 Tax=Loktanella atrilutea TaxID=366533 RepID=UPI00116016F2|nr:hypothetical protein [Loktanella atrilutea]
MYAHFAPKDGLEKAIAEYPFEDLPLILDGTIALGSADEVYKTLKMLMRPGDKCYLVTIHLPVGRDMTDVAAVRLMRAAVRDRGVDPDTIPYIIARHANTGKAHFHMVILGRTFAGRRVIVDLTVATTQASHRRQALAYGLPLPAYFDLAAVPTFRPPIILRRVDHKPTTKERRSSPGATQETTVEKARRHRLNTDLIRVFTEDQPTDLQALNIALDRIGAGYGITMIPGKRAKATFATTDQDPIFLNTLGPAWYVSALQARMAFATQLLNVRPVLALRFLLRAHRLNPTQDFHHDRHNANHADRIDARGTDTSPTGPHGGGDHPPPTVAQPSGEASHRGGGEPDQTPVPRPGYGDRGSGRVAGAGVGSRSADPGRDGGRRLTAPNGWIARLCRTARQFGGRLVKVGRNKARNRLAMIRFADGGHSVHRKSGHRVSVPSPNVMAFAVTWKTAATIPPSVIPDAAWLAEPQVVAEPELTGASSDNEDHDTPGM